MVLDPDVRAADELNTFLSRMQVPCGVVVGQSKGKYVCATSDINAEEEILEEVPLVSWPTADLTEAATATAAGAATAPSLFFCFHCLVCEWMTPPGSSTSLKVGPHMPWSYCPDCLSRFCGPTCVHAGRVCHELLCPYLSTLRAAEKKEQDGDDAEGDTKGEKAHGAGRKGCDVGERFITKEALARCVGVVLRKLITDITSQDLTSAMLEEDFQLNHPSGSSSSSASQRSDRLVSQLFANATAPFNRLISTADTMAFANIDFEGEWAPQLQYYLYARGKQVLDAGLEGKSLLSSALVPCQQGSATADDVPPSLPPADAHKEAEEKEAISAFALPEEVSTWEEEVLLGLLRKETLHTFLGQLALNAHAVNDFALFLARPPARRVASHVDPTAAPPSPPEEDVQPFFVKGAGVYSILSAFNHSCEPNMAIHNCKVTAAVPDESEDEAAAHNEDAEPNDSCCSTNHEIILVTTKPISEGEEMCISYIPLKKDETVVQRRAQLKGYFFQCTCPRCVREETGVRMKAATAEN